MIWIAPSEDDAVTDTLEKRLWDAVEQALPAPIFGLKDGRGAGGEGNSGDPSKELSINGVESTDETGRLCRLNLAVHGLEGEIKHGGNINSYYDDPHDTTGRFDFVRAFRLQPASACYC